MTEERKGYWVVKLPLLFAGYHLVVVLIALRFGPGMLLLEFPVWPLMILLVYSADKRVISVPNALAIPVLFTALLALWVVYGILLGRWMDRSGRWPKIQHETAPSSEVAPTGANIGYKIAAVAILLIVVAIMSLSK
jgi:hypothetical protein